MSDNEAGAVEPDQGHAAPRLRTLCMVLDTLPLITIGAAGYAESPPPGSDLPQDAAWYAKQAFGIRGAGDTPEAAGRDLIRRTRRWLDGVEGALYGLGGDTTP